jgi:nucleoside-diphosphate-sugar epimerase
MITTESELDDLLGTPLPEDISAMARIRGPLLILGAAGKMGPSLALRARRALDEAGNRAEVIAVSRFSEPGSRDRLEGWGIRTIPCELLATGALDSLPSVIFMAARKFGSSGAPALTWMINTFLPGLVARRYKDSRIVAFSSGNVYPLMPVDGGGATESTPTGPVGEYAQSVLGRERMFQHAATEFGTRVTLLRLNYAVEARYGVLVDIARKVYAGEVVDVSMGYVNAIWQGDANSVTLRSLPLCASPAFILNLTGPGTLRVRDLAAEFGRRFHCEPRIEGTEQPTALLNDAALCHQMFGPPRMELDELMRLVADWVSQGGRSLDKPTHFEMREGKY